ncbi:AAA family ATPase [Cyanobacterium stanieri LEGE 03274]|uniref:Nuclease SbcCD subunit C n=1 Tax=Cyanobacterium stanieri LEGE 03274 TaxID=1828756 RepID=A0ABR9V5N6_9CHRO|nr:AAA family ATPase [Cyanobacterium stanieri]MBE9223198.1 AAA family ATPase [Cyanobacterium stanieri LEGE 03274]
MKLISLQLNNFRQFYGETPIINFSGGEKHTTIIHGNNGAGKTTLLNAFTWVLYDKFTPAFSSPQLLINKRAINEVSKGVNVECSVIIVFDHNYVSYQVKRRCFACLNSQNKIENSPSTLSMMIRGDDGTWKYPHEKPEDIIENILPSSLHQYFFFDGEQIEHIFRSGERKKIAEDTKELIGVKLLERAIVHLKNARKTLQSELSLLGDIEVKTNIIKKNKLEQEIEDKEKQNNLIIYRLKKLEEDKQKISQQLLEMSGIKNLETLRNQLLKDAKDYRHQLINHRQKIKKILSRQGYLIYLLGAIAPFHDIVDKLREKGQLPSGIKKEFVNHLLEQKRCICGTELMEGNQPHEQVKTWMNKAGVAKIEEEAIRLDAQIKAIESQPDKIYQEIDQYQYQIAQYREKLSHIENEIDKINQQLREYPDKNIQSAQQELDNIEQHIRKLTLNQGETNLQIETITEEIKNLEKTIKKQEIKAQKYQLTQQRINATEESIQCLEEVKIRLENQFRLALQKRLQQIFNSISFTPYQPQLNQNYELNLIENTSGIPLDVAASTGENQILSLSFIGAIIDMVKQWSKENSIVKPSAHQFPIIMDSPFGSLDEIYRTQVAKAIPQLANQLVVLVTKTQWRIEVEKQMDKYINRQYVLVYRSPKQDSQEDYITINGKSYPLVTQSDNQFEYTEIIEVLPTVTT